MHLGKFRHKVSVANEFSRLAREDETAADILAKNTQYRQACYFLIQAMEKLIRAKIFNLVNPNLEYFRNRNRSHSLESAVEFLIEIVSNDKIVQEQVSTQLRNSVLGETVYSHLHNNLRYPAYFSKYDSYSMLDAQKKDYDILRSRLYSLKMFLESIHKLA